MPIPLLTLCSLRKEFPLRGRSPVIAVRDLQLELCRGDFFALMGPSGCGKTTLLHLIGGLTAPTSGRLLFRGVPLDYGNDRALTTYRRDHIGIIFQSYNLVPTLTLLENTTIQAHTGIPAAASQALTRAAPALLRQLGLGECLHRFPDSLSGGEQQRAAIARAVLPLYAGILADSILLADEPTGNLDSENSARICDLLRTLHRTRRLTILLATHSPEVARTADLILHMKDGAILNPPSRENPESATPP